MTAIARFKVEADGEVLSCLTAVPEHSGGQVLLMHGAGTGNKERYSSVIQALNDEGLEVAAFDFSGHGESTGNLAELSLKRRLHQAHAVLKRVQIPDKPLILMGFSMSGQTVCDLLSTDDVGPNVSAAVLCCPAAYAPSVYALRFGDRRFTEGIRQKDSWKTSSSFDVLREYAGPVLIVQPEFDEVIPQDVIDTMLASRAGRPAKHVLLAEGPHKIAAWLSDKPQQSKELAEEVTALIATL